MSIRTIKQVKSDALKECPKESGFKIGDKVTFTNEFGAKFNGLNIIGFCKPTYENGGWIYLDTDAYWFPHRADELTVEEV